MPKRRSAEQWKTLIQQHSQSGLSLAGFCRKKNLSVSSFHHWRRKLRPEPEKPGFVEIEPQPAIEQPHRAWLLELDLPGGINLRLRFEP